MSQSNVAELLRNSAARASPRIRLLSMHPVDVVIAHDCRSDDVAQLSEFYGKWEVHFGGVVGGVL